MSRERNVIVSGGQALTSGTESNSQITSDFVRKLVEKEIRKLSRHRSFWLFFIAIVFILVASGLLYLTYYLNHIYSQTSSSSISSEVLDNVLSQQSNVMTWFTVLATLIMTVIVTVTGFGYFNTRSVHERLHEIEDQKYIVEALYKQAEEKINSVEPYWNELIRQGDEIEKFKIPDSFEVPSEKDIKVLNKLAPYVDNRKIAKFRVRLKDSVILGMYYFVRKEYEMALEHFGYIDFEFDKNENNLIAISKYLQGRSEYQIAYNDRNQMSKFGDACQNFLLAILHNPLGLLSYFYYANALYYLDKYSGEYGDDFEDRLLRIIQKSKNQMKETFSENCAHPFLETRLKIVEVFIKYLACEGKLDISVVNFAKGLLDSAKDSELIPVLLSELEAEIALGDLVALSNADLSIDEYNNQKKKLMEEWVKSVENAIFKGKKLKPFIRYEAMIYKKYQNDIGMETFISKFGINIS
ncbi:MAG: hypothetical protein WBP41_03830 [Saprospiraceae bacterium]